MVSNCVAYGCSNVHVPNKAITFHTFPFKRSEILKLWITAIRRDNWYPSKTSRICGQHFLPTDFQNIPGSYRKLLKLDAVPSVFNFSHFIKNTGPQKKSLKPIGHIDEPMDMDLDLSLPSTSGIVSKTFVDAKVQSVENYNLSSIEFTDVKVTPTEVNLSLKVHSFTEESITIKREPDDFDVLNISESSGKTENEVDRNLDQKSTIQIHSHIKSEEDEFINSQYLISHEELNIKSEDDVEQSDTDTQFKNHKVRHRPNDQIIHKCPDCSYQSKHISYVKRHAVRHKKPDEIVWHHCTKCPYKTPWKTILKLQHAIVHNETRRTEIFKCAHCVFETPWKQSLKQHLLVHRREEHISWIYCPEPECPYKTYDKAKLKSHSLVHNNDQFFKCFQCPYQAKSRRHLKMHQLKHESTDKWHSCPQCPYKTIHKSSLKTHVWTHANPDQLEWYRCEHCSYKTYLKSHFKQHSFTHNKDHAKWLKCTFCSYVTLRKFDFKRHQMKHRDDDGPGWRKCPECPYKTIYNANLLSHTKNHKAADQTGWWQCPECSYRTPRKNRLKTHQQLHTRVVEWFHCFHCPYKTNFKHSLVSHMKMHLQTGQDKLTWVKPVLQSAILLQEDVTANVPVNART